MTGDSREDTSRWAMRVARVEQGKKISFFSFLFSSLVLGRTPQFDI